MGGYNIGGGDMGGSIIGGVIWVGIIWVWLIVCYGHENWWKMMNFGGILK